MISYISLFFILELRGIISGCNMKCDEQQPCKNKGICIENFEKGGSSCDCEHTSYYGDFCGLGKTTVILIFH